MICMASPDPGASTKDAILQADVATATPVVT